MTRQAGMPELRWTIAVLLAIMILMVEPILVAQSKEPIFLLPKMANRHGLIAGATGKIGRASCRERV